jgi:hypothetical protein
MSRIRVALIETPAHLAADFRDRRDKMPFDRAVLVLSLCVTVSGCGYLTETRRQASAGQTGCAPERIEVSEEERAAWVATCNGRRYRCSAGADASCTPEAPGNEPASLPPPPTPMPDPEMGVTTDR